MEKLIAIIKQLRVEDGWTKNMTPRQALDKFHEEMREVDTAIKYESPEKLCKELGDMLFHVFLQAEMAEDFEIEDCFKAICEKMTHRHLEPNQIDAEFLKRVELALGFKLFENQKRYLLGEPTTPTWGFRQVGKTTAYCIKLALSNGSPLDMSRPTEISDRDRRERNYATGFFKHKFLEIWHQLKDAGFKVRELKGL